MRPLTNLPDLPDSPTVFDPTSDSYVSYFAEEFSGLDSNGALLTADQADSQTGYALFGSNIDALGSLLDDAGALFDLLSADLDSVDLSDVILQFQQADAALDAGLSDTTFDLTTGAETLLSWVLYWSNDAMEEAESYAHNILFDAVSSLYNYIAEVISEIS